MLRQTPSFILLLFYFILPVVTFSQSDGNILTITAKIKSQRDSVFTGSLSLINGKDSSLIKSAFLSGGSVLIQTERKEKILLRISANNYHDTLVVIRADTDESFFDAGTIYLQLKTQEQEAVTVRAKIPLFEQKPGGLVQVNVQKTMLAASNNILEVLSKSPNIQVKDKSISVVTKGEAALFLNGKLITPERLASIPVTQIDKIRIITNPGPKYDAAGKAVIDIITLLNPSEGWQGVISQNLTFARHPIYTSSYNVHYRKNRWSLMADYGLNLGKDWNKRTNTRTIENGIYSFNSVYNHEENTRLTNISGYRFGVEYATRKNNSFSIQYDGLYHMYDLDIGTANNARQSNTNDFTYITTFNDGQTLNNNNAVSLNFSGSSGKSGSSFFAGVQYSFFKTRLYDLISEKIFKNNLLAGNALRKNDGRNDIEIFSYQTDYSRPLKNGGLLEAGLKYAHVQSSGRILFSTKRDGDDIFIPDPVFSNNFTYAEKIPAGYLQYSKTAGKEKKLKYNLGMRAELTDAKGFSARQNKNIIDSSYFNLFPSLSLNYAPGGRWNYDFSYAARINRPLYQDLDPFIWYLDSLSSFQGNPNTRPELTHSLEAVIAYRSYSLKAGYSHTRNAFRFIAQKGSNGPNTIVISKANIERLNSYFVTLLVPFEGKWWSTTNSVSLTLNKVVNTPMNFSVINSPIPQLYIYSFHKIKIPRVVNVETTFEYAGKTDDGIFRISPAYSFSLGLAKPLLNGRLITRALFSDVARTYREKGAARIGEITNTYDKKLNTFFARASIIYFFGKLQNVRYANKGVGKEQIDRVKQ
jgi:Outer membrane protein beta-barrel family